MEYVFLLFIFGFVFLNSINIQRETITILLLLGGFYYYYEYVMSPHQKISKIKNSEMLETYMSYDPEGIKELLENIKEFSDTLDNYTITDYEKLNILRRDITERMLQVSMNINNEDDTHSFLTLAKKLDGKMEEKIKINHNKNTDIMLEHPDDPKPLNFYDR
tara:strand:- start:1974 stop:2459 length:486 start_codon:yes stop_codon:yes gene_type:complete